MKLSTSLVILALSSSVLSVNAQPQADKVPTEMEQAIAAYESDNLADAKLLLEQQPKSALKLVYLGKIAFAQEQLEQAEEYFEDALKLDKTSSEAHYMLGSVSMQLAASASIFSAPGYASTAKESLAKAIELEPSHIEAMIALAQFYIYAPSIVGGDIDKAEALAMQLAKYSKLESLYVNQMIFHKKGAKDQLAQLSQQLMSEFSDSAEAVLTPGFIYQELEQYEQAFSAFEKSRALSRQDKDDLSPEYALFQIGKTAVLSETRLEQGVKALQEYIDLEQALSVPSIDWATYRLAQLKHLQGDKQQALKLASNAKQSTEDEELEDKLKDFIKAVKKS